MRRSVIGNREKKLFIKRFYPAGTYTWVVPNGCTEVDVFLVGGGGGAFDLAGGGGGFTKTFKSSDDGYKDGDSVKVAPGQSVQIIVGKGGKSVMSTFDNEYAGIGNPGGYSQFLNSSYRANGGGAGKVSNNPRVFTGGKGGSNGSAYLVSPGSDGSPGQGHTTRDFGESSGKINAGGGGNPRINGGYGGTSDYTDGRGTDCRNTGEISAGRPKGLGGGGYGGGAGAGVYTNTDGATSNITSGGDGTVLIRYYAYEE